MIDRDEQRFRPRPGRVRGQGDAGGKRFTSQVLRAAQKTGGGSSRPLTRTPGRGAEKGRGHVAARLVGSRLGPRSRRVVVKARLLVHAQAAPGSTAAHLRYIQRDSVTREGEPDQAYSASRDLADTKAFEARVQGDRHEFRFIVSPEDAAEIGELRDYTRDLMRRMEADLGSKLEWVGVDHWDTDNPHSHVVLRGVDDCGRDLVIARDYISHGLRGRASELATDLLGPQTELEMRERMTREVGQERWTGLDRELAGRARAGVLAVRNLPQDGDHGLHRRLLLGRLQTLEGLQLAEPSGPGQWTISPAAESTLRTMGERGDIIRTMQRALGGEERQLAIFDAETSKSGLVGRVAAKGLVDELQDRGFLVVDGVDGQAHYVALPPGSDLSSYPNGGIVEIGATSRAPRAVDHTIAANLDGDGVYRVDTHLAQARREARRGDDPETFVGAHVRRLEALRRAGLVERIEEGKWRIPADFLVCASAYDTARFGNVKVELRSHLPIDRQTRAIGATWLDRALLDGSQPAANGFGGDVRSALEERGTFLVEGGLATRRGQRLVLARDLLATLRRREVDQVGRALAAESGLDHRPVEDGRVSGVYRRSVLLNSGRFAMLDDGLGLSLVPWKPIIEQRLGQSITGVVRGGSVSWDLSRQRGIGVG